MKEKIIHYVKEIAIFLLVMTILANIISLYKSTDLNNEPLPINNFTLINDSNYEIDNAKPVLIHFWASWCPTCKLEASNIQTISENFQVITIAVKSGEDEDIHKWLKENGYDFNTVNDNSGYISAKFNISAFPTTFVYDKEKNLVFSEVGYTSTWGLWLRMFWSSI